MRPAATWPQVLSHSVEQRVGQEARMDTERHAVIADHEQERLANRSGNLHANNGARVTIPNAPGE